MRIVRIENARDMDVTADTITVVMKDGAKFTLTEHHGELKVHSHHDVMTVKPCCANELTIDTYDS